jgi:protein ImuB
VAAGVADDEPAAVVHASRVVACSSAARAEGVRRGLRRREAEGRCPGLALFDQDHARDVRAFEPVVAVVESFAPRAEVVRPGVTAVATRGPSRYFGGDASLGTQVVAAVRAVLPAGAAAGVGVAEGTFAAILAARTTAGWPERPVAVIEPGATRAFLDPLPVTTLGSVPGAGGRSRPELVDLLQRLGIRTLGGLAALPEADVVARFGPDGGRAWCRAHGLDDRPLDARTPPPDLMAEVELDPPAQRVDTAAFAARALAADLGERLAALGLACTRVAIGAETEHGERLTRLWRHDGPFTPGALAERVRWQLDGWLTDRAASAAGPGGTGGIGAGVGAGAGDHEVGDEATTGLTRLWLVPDEVVRDGGRQLGFWGGDAAADERAARGLARVHGLLGPDGVVTAVLGGGRGPSDQVRLVPWGDPREPARPGPLPVGVAAGPGSTPPPTTGRRPRRPRRAMGPAAGETPPWPGRLPGPQPVLVPVEHEPAEVVDGTGQPVAVSGRGAVSAQPARLRVGERWVDVAGWAGPWPADERWWDALAHRRRARFQVATADGTAHLLALEGGRWWVEATYD